MLEVIDSMHMLRKGQGKRFGGRDLIAQAKFFESLFGVAT
jgi:hypothetical protein